MSSAVLLSIQGRVQGVGFRYFAQDAAQELGLAGWVRNTPEGAVEAYAEGPKKALETWIDRLRQGPPLSKVEGVQASWGEPQITPSKTFSIR